MRRLDADGTVSTVAGNGTSGYSGDGADATAAQLKGPTALAADATGNLFIADTGNNVVRKVDTNGPITTVVGKGTAGYGGDLGPPKEALLSAPSGLAFDSHGFLYVAEWGNHVVRAVDLTANLIDTVAGNHTPGYSGDGENAKQAQLNGPRGLAVDAADNLLIADTTNNPATPVTVVPPPRPRSTSRSACWSTAATC